MKAFVDKDGCISCGLCVNICPDVFQFDDDQKAEAVCDPIPVEQEESAREAADGCPVSVIEIED